MSARSAASEVEDASLSSKECLIGRIKHNFQLETRNCQLQGHNGAEEGSSDADLIQTQLRRVKRRCAKLERKVQEKDKEILALQEQQQLRYPLLMHETMRSLQSLERNQLDSQLNELPLSHSVISDKAQERRDADARIHEYEQQVAKLYEEIQQEKLNNKMLNECLRDQKHSKAKLMKACKHMKQELQAMKDSGLSQMLVDIEARCNALEKEKEKMAEALQKERCLRVEQVVEQEKIAKQLEDVLLEFAKWEEIVDRKNRQLQQSRDQICEQQLAIENLKTDLKNAERKTGPPEFHEEIEQLKGTVSTERARADDAQKTLQRVAAENDILLEKLATQAESKLVQSDAPCTAQATYNKVMIQVRYIKHKLRALTGLIQTYEETNAIDMNLLNEGSWMDAGIVEEVAIQSCEKNVARLSGGVLEVSRSLSELQQAVEDVCARLLGSNCALQ
ncbi:hypothetical protein PHYBOEH_002656 [Phytophthora boehmeriae]|uniref:Uncharacterized protein n=1 Tax=Phytophthora boehmeriae TaxID=109152 RepID=A0A8T1WWH1_9STRA|nr:hypothetical protein PHYBOEH_002656 [Phytophthora boehmeriae]